MAGGRLSPAEGLTTGKKGNVDDPIDVASSTKRAHGR